MPDNCFTQDIGSDQALALTAQGAGTINGTVFSNPARGVRATISISGKSGTISVVANIQAYDPTSNTFTTLLASVAITANGTTVLTVHPDIPAATNVTAQNHTGERFRVQLVSGAGVTPSFNSTVGICLLA